MMKKFVRIVAVIMLCCISLLCVGCFGKDNVTTAPGHDDNISTNPDRPGSIGGGGSGGSGSTDKDDKDDFDDEDFDDEDLEGVGDDAVIGMYGTKVLYRPDSYDYDAGSGGNGEKNNYYGKYAWYLLNHLFNFYAIPNKAIIEDDFDDPLTEYNEGEEYYGYLCGNVSSGSESETSFNHVPYYYDSIRYRPNILATVTHETKPVWDVETEKWKNETTDLKENNNQYIVVGADLSSRWNWSFSYDLMNLDPHYNALFIDEEYSDYKKGRNNVHYLLDGITLDTEINDKYLYDTDFINFYKKVFLGFVLEEGQDAKDYESQYSDFVKTMEYVVYSYALNIEPQMVTVTVNEGANQFFNPDFNPDLDPEGRMHNLYQVSIGAYESVDEALEDITDLFHEKGSHVGLLDTQIRKIANWIKENVIGLGTSIKTNDFTTYTSATAVYDEDGNLTGISYNDAGETIELYRNYEETVDRIVRAVCKYVPIGKDPSTGEDVTIDDKFLASEVMEYAGESFFIDGDENFPAPPKPGEEISPKAILPLEYQSVVIMLNEPTCLSDVVLALKYDADNDGTQEGVYDMKRYLDIIVELNYYSHKANRLITLGSEKTRIYDGPYEFGVGSGEFPEYNLPEDHGTVWFTIDANNPEYKDLLIDVENDPGVLPIGAFNPDIGGGILKTDVGHNNYLRPYVSKNPLVLSGLTDVRKYYSIIEPDDEEIGDPSLTYTTGRFNPDMFAGSDGCDYLEITYKVLKKKGDRKTNYSFYTGIVGVFNSDMNVGGDKDDEWL